MNWLVTGGCGFIGRALLRRLLAEGAHAVRVYDDLSVGTREDLGEVRDFEERDPDADPAWSAPLELAVGDVLDADRLRSAASGADVVVHLAASTGVGPSVDDPVGDCRANVLGTLHALEAARHAGTGRLVFASSGAPLGVQEPPLHEEMAPHPASPYGASKLAGEGYCSAYHHCFGLDTVVLRFGNVYGEGSARKESVVAKFIKRALAGEAWEIYGDGSQTRDFIYLGDLIAAVRAAATEPGVGGETFQIATSSETTLDELVERLAAAMREETGITVRWGNVERRAGDVERNFSDTSKARRLLGWRAETTLDEGLRRTVRYFARAEKSAGQPGLGKGT